MPHHDSFDAQHSQANHRPGHKLVILTGLSGAGKSIALKAFEDIGYETIDNLPLSVLPDMLRPGIRRHTPLVVGIDARNRDFSVEFFEDTVAHLDREAISCHILFMDCSDEVIQQRFSETRRRHPMAEDRLVSDGIRIERALLAPVKTHADEVIDTSALPTAELRNWIKGRYETIAQKRLHVHVLSFSFKQGLPRDADIVWDVRFLRNPYYDENLRAKTGQEKPVADYIRADAAYPSFFDSLTQMLGQLLPKYQEEGKTYLTIAIGCTGGIHRSVFVAEELKQWLETQGVPAGINHRALK